MIALIVSIIMIVYLEVFHIALALLALAYLFIGVFIPLVVGKVSGNKGLDYRNTYGKYTSYVLSLFMG